MMNDATPSRRERETAIAFDGDGASTVPGVFAEGAAKISCYVGLAVYVHGGALSRSPSLEMCVPIGNLAGFVLAVVGLVGGARCESREAVRMGALSVVLNGLPLLAKCLLY